MAVYIYGNAVCQPIAGKMSATFTTQNKAQLKITKVDVNCVHK